MTFHQERKKEAQKKRTLSDPDQPHNQKLNSLRLGISMLIVPFSLRGKLAQWKKTPSNEETGTISR